MDNIKKDYFSENPPLKVMCDDFKELIEQQKQTNLLLLKLYNIAYSQENNINKNVIEKILNHKK